MCQEKKTIPTLVPDQFRPRNGDCQKRALLHLCSSTCRALFLNLNLGVSVWVRQVGLGGQVVMCGQLLFFFYLQSGTIGANPHLFCAGTSNLPALCPPVCIVQNLAAMHGNLECAGALLSQSARRSPWWWPLRTNPRRSLGRRLFDRKPKVMVAVFWHPGSSARRNAAQIAGRAEEQKDGLSAEGFS